MRIYIRHMRAAGYCRKEGVKPFFNARNWDWQDFLANGIEAQKLIDTNDVMALRVVEIAKAEENGQRKEANGRV
ncbi:hypothetical protein [Acinetobacter sp. YH12251]|uniref:hypothetical protein n=1 Tax=Acinetobacter sp. YH12251 TaxID=2601176 RepID=UPI0015D20E67|nr:hypothetical protein [Acinetobacter sp. YH12251]